MNTGNERLARERADRDRLVMERLLQDVFRSERAMAEIQSHAIVDESDPIVCSEKF